MSQRVRTHYVVSIDTDNEDASIRMIDKLFEAVIAVFPEQHPSVAFEFEGKQYILDEGDYAVGK